MAHHGHSHSQGCCSAEKLVDDLASAFNLFLKIDTDRVECLNEAVDNSGKTVFKPWHRRTDKIEFVESDVDEELLFKIPFTGNVKLKGILLVGGEEDTHPREMRLFKNRPGMTFDDTGAPADQEFELTRDEAGVVEYPIKVSKFNNTSQLCIHFPTSFGAEHTKLYYIGLRGDFMRAQQEEIMIVNYELSANPADHKADALKTVSQEIS